MGKDKRGVNRGSCQKCDCKEYEVYDKRLLCDYCGHRPVDHEVLKDDERPKRKCSPKKDVSPKKRKIAEKKGSPVALVKVEPLQTAGGKRIMSVSTGPVTRRSRRRRPMSEENAEDENKTDAKESVDESEKDVVQRKKPKVSGKEVMNTETENVEDEVPQVAVELRTDVVVEVELDPENREGLEKDEQEEEEKEVKSDVDVNSKDTNEIANTSIAASRTRRSTAGLKLSKIVQKERDSDESTDEESEEAEGGNTDIGLFPHYCPKCNKRFKLLSNLVKHRKEHAQQKYNQRKYICGICNSRFLTHTDLKSHLRTHSSPAKPLSCDDCGKEYKDELALNAHKKIHMADHLYACNVCYKTFTRRHDLKRHQASVHDDYHYVCGVCGLMYKSRKTLTNHEIIHQNDNSHMEDTSVVELSEETSQEDNTILVASSEEDVVKLEDTEERTERPKRKSYAARGDRIFDCLLCVKSYTAKDQLRQHILAHAGKYQYVCDFCGQGFFVPKQLKDHIFKAHGDTEGREFNCTECCCCFRTEEDLLKHGEWHGERDSRVIISNKKLVQLIQKLDSSTTEDFMTNRSFWAESDKKDDSVPEEETVTPGDQDIEGDQSMNESNQNENNIQEDVKDEVKIQIELDASLEDLDDAEADKLLFGGAKEEKVEKPFTCKICLKAFTEKMYCRCHVLAHVGVFRHQCQNCGLGFLKNSDLKRHGIRCKKKNRKHKTVAMHCNDCQLMFDNQIEYMQHRQEVCSKTWIESVMRDENTEKVNEEEGFNLELLKEKLKIQPESLIKSHEGITNSGKPLRTCIVEGCTMQFQNRPQLKQHLKHAHGIVLGAVPRKGEKKSLEAGTFKEGLLCTICGAKFKSSVQLTDHRATMHGEKGYSCSICGKAFGRKYDCQRHEENVHYGVNSRHCDICGKVCKDKYTVQIHKKVVHEHIKEHVCPQCGHKFSQRSNLNNHMRTHTQEKPYQCQECLKWFSTRQYRDMHMRIHTGERPHKCTYCSRTFSHPASLKYHIRTHEDDRPYPCFTCPRKFRDPSKRTKHIKTCPGEQSMIITRSIPGQTVITSEDDGQVTLQLEQSVINNLLLDQETTQIQIREYPGCIVLDKCGQRPHYCLPTKLREEHDDTIEDEHVQQIEQLIQDNQIQLEDEGTQVLVLDQGESGDAETVYLLVPSDTVSVE